MDRFEAMSVLLRVVEAGSFTGAARALGMPLASVSRKIADLEAHLGTPLLKRTTRTLALSDAGADFIASARQILDALEEAERKAAGAARTPHGELTVTAPVLFGRLHILPIVTEFLALYPEIDVRLVLADHNLNLIEDHVDVAARIGRMPDSSLVASRVGEMREVTCVAPAYLDAHPPVRAPQDLARLAAINFYPLASNAPWIYRHPTTGRRLSVALHARLSVTLAEAAVEAAIAGAGVARVFHYQCAEAVRAGLLRLVLEPFEPAPLPVQLVHAPRDAALPTKTRIFIDFAAPRLRARLRALL